MITQENWLKLIFGGVVVVSIIAILMLPGLVAAEDVVIKDQTSCEAAGGGWNRIGMCVIDTLVVSEGDSLEINDAWLRVEGKLEVDGLLVNNGVVDISGQLALSELGHLINRSLIFVRLTGSIDNASLIDNLGEVSNGGAVNNEDGIIDNHCLGVIYGSGTIPGNDPLRTPGSAACSFLIYLPYLQ